MDEKSSKVVQFSVQSAVRWNTTYHVLLAGNIERYPQCVAPHLEESITKVLSRAKDKQLAAILLDFRGLNDRAGRRLRMEILRVVERFILSLSRPRRMRVFRIGDSEEPMLVGGCKAESHYGSLIEIRYGVPRPISASPNEASAGKKEKRHRPRKQRPRSARAA